MIEDIKDTDQQSEQASDDDIGDDIEDTNSEKFKYDWDDVKNQGKRLKPGGRWQLCHRQEKDRASGFMKCIWDTPSGEEHWISEMTILEYEANEPIVVAKKPAANKKPAACLKKPAAAKSEKKKMDATIRKREHSKIYHQTFVKAKADGNTDEVAKAKAREAAKKHIQQMINML